MILKMASNLYMRKWRRNDKMRKQAILLIIAVLTFLITGCGLNISVVNNGTDQSDVSGQREVIRLDEDGYIYYMDYTKDYYGSDVIDALKKDGFIDTGCSTFLHIIPTVNRSHAGTMTMLIGFQKRTRR